MCHHLIHWADGGPTDLTNAALLCRAHHTVVHRQRYPGHVIDTSHGPAVHWDLVPGGYDDRLEALRKAGTIPRWPDPDPDEPMTLRPVPDA
ncbi:HNH endonuclease [Pedococcus dokdonensis]|uniref:HNH endonuclease n=1 Tax=Pedococcus dokdonensis TaxID=443156 RepID=UPI000A7CCF78|nr:HNH endonuclease [Pedococcus dokdonensis]